MRLKSWLTAPLVVAAAGLMLVLRGRNRRVQGAPQEHSDAVSISAGIDPALAGIWIKVCCKPCRDVRLLMLMPPRSCRWPVAQSVPPWPAGSLDALLVIRNFHTPAFTVHTLME